MIKRALLSASDKTGLIEFAQGLHALGVELISTGGTAHSLREAGIQVRDISDLTGFPEILGGRVKTLHPKVHGGLLGIRGNPEHERQMKENGIALLDLVVVNLYPFEATAARVGVSFEEVIENIDIGGPSMVRSAAKNFRDVAVVVNSTDYSWVLEELRTRSTLSLESRFRLAQKAFALTASYDAAIASHLSRFHTVQGSFECSDGFPQRMFLDLEKVSDLRYGENPHQKAAFYREVSSSDPILASAEQIQGKELSFNNLMDLNAAFQLVFEFKETGSVIIKHTNPCGVAVSSDSQTDAYVRARECDPLSAFGSVLGFNRPVEKDTAREIVLTFVEAIIAPDFDSEAISLLSAKKNLRLIRLPNKRANLHPLDYKRIEGGVLVQQIDRYPIDAKEWKVVSKRAPTEVEMVSLEFAGKVAKHVKSNAIVYARDKQTVGIGAGQMSRVDSAQIGISKAGLAIQGSVMASDAFFPFRDSIDLAAKAGVRAVIQPGGSLKDAEVIEAADEHSMAMVLTGTRHFKH